MFFCGKEKRMGRMKTEKGDKLEDQRREVKVGKRDKHGDGKGKV